MKDLFVSPESEETKTGQAFLDATTKGYKDARTENYAVSHSSTGDIHLDDFSKSGAYRKRKTEIIFNVMSQLWKVNPDSTLKLALYLRLITRKVKGFFPTETVQRGQGNRDESLRRLLWVAYEHPKAFYANLWLVPLVGSFKDLWTLMGIDYKNKLDHDKFFEIMRSGLDNKDLHDLVLKYMPQIKSKSRLKTSRAKALNALAKEFATYLEMNFKQYRKLKSSGEAHLWQQNISRGYFDRIDFKAISGKALQLLVKSKFLANNKLEARYTKWIESQPIAKFTGYVYELFAQVTTRGNRASGLRHNLMTPYQAMTINKQFDGLIETAKKDRGGIIGNVWCALDTSGSMSWSNLGEGDKIVTALDICVSLGIYFSALNEGAFKDHVIMFDNKSTKLHLNGKDFIHKCAQVPPNAMGGTNFQSVIDEIVNIRKANPNIPVEDYPQTLLVVSDMQFNPATNHYGYQRGGIAVLSSNVDTNYEVAMKKLDDVGLPPINIIWWDVTGRGTDVPVREGDTGTAVISGFDGAIITQILGGGKDGPVKAGEIDMHQVLLDAINQDILAQVKIP